MTTMIHHRLTLLFTLGLAVWQTQPCVAQTYLLDFVAGMPAPAIDINVDPVRAKEASLIGHLPTTWDADAKHVPFELTLVELDRGAMRSAIPCSTK